MPVIGYLYSGWREPSAAFTMAFHRGLSQSGYVEGRNVAIEYRYAEGQYERLPALAADLVNRQETVIVAPGDPAAFAAQAANITSHIGLTTVTYPVRSWPDARTK